MLFSLYNCYSQLLCFYAGWLLWEYFLFVCYFLRYITSVSWSWKPLPIESVILECYQVRSASKICYQICISLRFTSITKHEVNVSHKDGPWTADPLITISGYTSRGVISCRAELVLRSLTPHFQDLYVMRTWAEIIILAIHTAWPLFLPFCSPTEWK